MLPIPRSFDLKTIAQCPRIRVAQHYAIAQHAGFRQHATISRRARLALCDHRRRSLALADKATTQTQSRDNQGHGKRKRLHDSLLNFPASPKNGLASFRPAGPAAASAQKPQCTSIYDTCFTALSPSAGRCKRTIEEPSERFRVPKNGTNRRTEEWGP